MRATRVGVDDIDRFDWEIVEFVISWASYGGPPDEESLVRFGLTRTALMQRFLAILEAASRNGVALRPAQREIVLRARDLVAWAEPLAVHTVQHGPAVRVTDTSAPLGVPRLRRGVWRWT